MRNPEETLLYRGDAAEISEFDVSRTDKWALFSRGIYLTDCPKIANDYTVKGGGDTVFVAKRANSVRDLVSEYLHHIMVKELGFEALAQKLHQEWSRRVTSENCKEMERGLTLERIILIRRLMPKAKKLFAERRSSLRVFLDTTGQWTLVASATPGIITAFNIPDEVISRCLHADRPLPDSVVAGIRTFILSVWQGGVGPDAKLDMRDRDHQFLTFDQWLHEFREVGVPYVGADDENGDCVIVGGKGLNPSLDEIWHGTYAGENMIQGNYPEFVSAMNQMGFLGLEYDGGVRFGGTTARGGGGHRHRAYVFWDAELINRYRATKSETVADVIAEGAEKGIRAGWI